MRNSIFLFAFLGILLLGGCMGCNSYNGFVTSGKSVENAWAEVQGQYQRRADLIPNIVNTVKGEANFEKSTLTEIAEARAKATSMNIDPKDVASLTPEQLQKFEDNQKGLSGAIGRLLMVTESYPNLKANQGFADLRAQLEGTENRIQVARKNFNEVATDYNTKVSLFPGVLFARMFGFQERPLFQADKGAEKAPKVEF
jgi:LemA protein